MHPYLLQLGHFSLPTFGVLAAVGLMLALELSQRTAAMARVDPDKLWNAGLFAVIAAFVFSRLLLVITNLHSFLQYPLLLLAVPSLTAAGLLLTVVAVALWLHFKRVRLLAALDAWTPCATLVWAFLALGHFAEGSDPGTPTTPRFGVAMPGESTPLHPVAIYAALIAMLLTVLLLWHLRRAHSMGQIAATGCIAAGASQFLLSFVRQPGAPSIAELDLLQVVALGMILAGVVAFVASVKPPAERQ